VAYRSRALRVRVMVGYVLRPSPDNSYVSSLCSVCSFGRHAQGGVDPSPPSRSACGGSHCVARCRLDSPASRPPRWGSPKPSQPPYRQRRLFVSGTLWQVCQPGCCFDFVIVTDAWFIGRTWSFLRLAPLRSDIGVAFGLDDTARPVKYVHGFRARYQRSSGRLNRRHTSLGKFRRGT